MTKVTCVLPVHNEMKYLPYSMPQFLNAPFNEVVTVLDRCTDGSDLFFLIHADNRFILIWKYESYWKTSVAEAKKFGLRHATGDFVFMTDADVLLDFDAVKKAVKKLDGEPELDVVCFIYKLYSLYGTIFDRVRDEWMNLFAKVTRKLSVHPTRSGVYMARKEKLGLIEDKPSEYDNLQQKCNVATVETNTLHLRPRYDKEAQVYRGQVRAGLPQYSLFKTFVACVLQLQVWMLIGYLFEKRRR